MQYCFLPTYSLYCKAGNNFSPILEVVTDPRHISNLADNHIDYYFTSGFNEKPLYIVNVDTIRVVNAHGCPSSFGGGGNEVDPSGLAA